MDSFAIDYSTLGRDSSMSDSRDSTMGRESATLQYRPHDDSMVESEYDDELKYMTDDAAMKKVTMADILNAFGNGLKAVWYILNVFDQLSTVNIW